MKIVVNHLTRMRGGYICVAGIDPTSGKHVRPQPEHDRWRKPDLVGRGGAFDIGSLVELGRVSYVGQAPEWEDYQVQASRIQRSSDFAAGEFWALLSSASKARLRDIFGDDLRPMGRGYVVDVGRGSASLGCLALAHPPFLQVTRPDEVRLRFTASTDGPSIKVTDLRLYEGAHGIARRNVVHDLTTRMSNGARVILGVGLGRPWQKDGDAKPRHWLQVNNIHLEDQPVWCERFL